MTNWQSPTVQLADFLAYIKFVHLLAGVYIWEFILNLNFDYSVIMRKRRFVWTQLLYMGCRWCSLFTIIVLLVGFDTTPQIDCTLVIILVYIFGYATVMFASSLIILRILALWEKNWVIITVVSGCWLANAISYIYSVATFGGKWVGMMCGEDHTLNNRVSVFSTFTTDFILLVLMLTGALRWKGARESGSICSLLYKQGLAWAVVFALAEAPPMVFLILNLNYPMDVMFIVPGPTIISIAATRIYLGLINCATFDNHPVGAVDIDKRAIKTPIRFPAPSHQSNLTDNASTMRMCLS